MTSYVVVLLEEEVKNPIQYLAGLLPNHYRVFEQEEDILVEVPESSDAVEEMTRVFEGLGVRCTVEEAPKWIITDWFNNRCFPEKVFLLSEDAWGFIREEFPDDEEEWDEYIVEPLLDE